MRGGAAPLLAPRWPGRPGVAPHVEALVAALEARPRGGQAGRAAGGGWATGRAGRRVFAQPHVAEQLDVLTAALEGGARASRNERHVPCPVSDPPRASQGKRGAPAPARLLAPPRRDGGKENVAPKPPAESHTAALLQAHRQRTKPTLKPTAVVHVVDSSDDDVVDDDDDDFDFVAPPPRRTNAFPFAPVFRPQARNLNKRQRNAAGTSARPSKAPRIVLPAAGPNAAAAPGAALTSADPAMSAFLTRRRKAAAAAAAAEARSKKSDSFAARDMRAWATLVLPKALDNACLWRCEVAPYDRTRGQRALALANSAAAAVVDSIVLSQAALGGSPSVVPATPPVGPRARLPDRPLVVASIVNACADSRDGRMRPMGSQSLASQMVGSQLLGSQALGLVSDERLACKAFRRSFDAVLLHPSWERSCGGDPARLLADLRLLSYCPRGFVLIFLSKCVIGPVFAAMKRLGFTYVENLTWCLMTGSAAIASADSRMRRDDTGVACAACGRLHPVRCGHTSLYFFRRDHKCTKKLELRHQRSPDVLFDFVRHSAHGAPPVVRGDPCVGDIVHPSLELPEEIYATVNTLLPGAHGRLLELYANAWHSPSAARSNGWTRVAEHGAVSC